MRVLLVTWDGAGNLPPFLALISGLAARGHEVIVLAHDSQQASIQQAGGQFRSYPSAPQLDQGTARTAFDFNAWFRDFNEKAARDLFKVLGDVKPNVLVVDCMMGPSLSMGWATETKIVALVHAAYSYMSPWSTMIAGAARAIGCTYEDFDKGTKFPKNLTFVGPLRPAVQGQPWQRKFPERPLVVASLSTGIQGPFQLGLLQRVCDALSGLPVEALITTGRGIAPEEISVGANTAVERNVEHSVVLPQASLLITHCGHGSVMASLRAGIPMLCLPPIADQPHNAELVRRLELGEVMDVMAPVPQLSEAILRLLANTEMQKAAKKFAKKKTYEPELDKAVKLVEKLAR